MTPPFLLAVMGATGSGKSDLAEAAASRWDAVLLNADAFQVYRGLDIGTNKPEDRSRCRLLDLRDPWEEFGLGEWLLLAHKELSQAWENSQSVVVAGGTGLYVRALMEEYADLREAPDPELRLRLRARLETEGLQALAGELAEQDRAAAAQTDLRNPVRVLRALERLSSPPVPIRPLPGFRRAKVALPPPTREQLRQRLGGMMQKGWLNEVQGLLEREIPADAPGMRAIGYRTWYDHLHGVKGYEDAFDDVLSQTAAYAKRQMTWLRKEPNLQWLDSGTHGETERLIESVRWG